MKKTLKFLAIFIAIFGIFSSELFSQPWVENLNKSLPSTVSPTTHTWNFYDLQKAAYEYWADKDTTVKGIGWKPFKRWEWFWEQRVYPTGQFPDAGINYREANNFKQLYGNPKNKKNKVQSTPSWVSLGPDDSPGGYAGLGRINCVRENPANSSKVYIGSAGGGFWYSNDGGSSWATSTDHLGAIGVTDIVIHPTNNNIIFIATGDGDHGDNYSVGVMKSVDGGLTWTTTGLSFTQNQTRTISRMLIDPTNPDIMYAGGNFGIYKTTDGGNSWSLIFSSIAVKDMEFKSGNSAIIFAAGTVIYRSTNSGTNWSQLTSGLPSSAQRVALGVTPANANYIYALMSNSGSGYLGMYRSTDGGDNWTTQSTTPNLLGWYEGTGDDTGGQGWYDLCMAVDQTDANVIYTGGVNVWKSTNGGVNWGMVAHWYGGFGAPEVHADHHDLWFAPGSNRLYSGNDGGIYRTTNSGSSWSWLGSGLTITQFYRVGAAQTAENLWIAGAQDNGTKNYVGTWQDVIGGDGMDCMIDNQTTQYQYGALYYGRILQSTDGGYNFYDWVQPSAFSSENGAWVAPYTQHPTNNSTIYIGYRNVYKTTNRGSSWTKISPFTSSSTLTVLSVSPDDASTIVASHGSDYMVTTDGGANWNTYSKPTGQYLTSAAIVPNTPNVIYTSYSGYSAGQKVYVTNNYGLSWTNISYNLPNLPVNNVQYHKTTGRIYVGTDVGVYYLDPGQTQWVSFSDGLPNVVVNDIDIQYAYSKMKVATYGRGVWETEIFSGNAPTLTLPTNNAIDQEYLTTFTWNTINKATNYEIMVADNSTFTNPVLHKTTIIGGTYTLLAGEELNSNTLYYWKVRAIDDYSYGAWSATWQFTTKPNLPAKVVLSSPANLSTNQPTSGTLTWEGQSDILDYTLLVATDAGFNNLVVNTTTANTNYDYSSFDYNTTYYWKVRARKVDGFGEWSDTWTFGTGVPVPTKVDLKLPANNSTDLPASLDLSWYAATWADTYNLLVATDMSFNNIIAEVQLLANTTYHLSGLNDNTTYYWKVVAKNISGYGDWSDTWNFTTVLPVPNQVVLVSPANNAINQMKNLELDWNPAVNADSYKLQVATDINFTTLIYDETGLVATEFDITNLNYNTQYFWRVRGTNISGDGAWSNTWNFTTYQAVVPDKATLSLPSNGATNLPLSVTFTWNAANNATEYKLQVAYDAAFNNLHSNLSGITTLNKLVTGFDANSTYYWRVAGVNEFGTGEWSDARTFSTSNNLPATVTLNIPTNNTIYYENDISLSWYQGMNAITYNLQVATDYEFTNVVYDYDDINALTYSFTDLATDEYYWRVRGKNNQGHGYWSIIRRFTVDYVIPAKVNLSSPSNNATDLLLSQSLKWQTATGAATYQVQVSTASDFSTLLINANTTATNFGISGLASNTTYYWRVRGVHPSNVGEWSDTWNFTTLNTTITLNLSNKSTCKGTSVALGTLDEDENIITATGGSGDFTYTWYPAIYLQNANTGNPTYLNPQTAVNFSVTVKDNQTGVSATGWLQISVINGPTVSMYSFKVIRKNSSYNLNNAIISISGGQSPYTKVWKDAFGNVLSNTVVSPNPGTHSYYLTVSDANGCASVTKKFTLVVTSRKEGIDENNITVGENGNLALVAYPNPTDKEFFVYPIATDNNNLTLELNNSEGKTLMTTMLQSLDETIRIDMTQYPAGVYFVKLINGSDYVIYKFIKM